MTQQDYGLNDFIAVSRYSRYRSDLGRREVWPEAVARVRDMHLRRFADKGIDEDIRWAFDLVEKRKVLPSMRSIQFGGAAIEQKNARMFNCSFSFADRPRFFSEAFYMLLCGTGVGFSVQKHHVEKLPVLHDPREGPQEELPFVIPDNIEGWADAVEELITSHIYGWIPVLDYSEIRPQGAPLVTAGGKAPGPEPLKKALEAIDVLLTQARGRKLRPIEVYDIVMHLSQAVLSGGVRRSATICLFSADDLEMAKAKTGDWFVTHPQRAFSNNSAILPRDTATKEEFLHLFEQQKQFGEPGFYFTASTEYGVNPCCEIGLNPTIDGATGWQMCNLSTINGSVPRTPNEFYDLCKAASLIGTLQASYSDIEYLGPVTRAINDREALLGVSICGILDNPTLLLHPEVLETGAQVVRLWNTYYAEKIGINPAARLTCVKPEGTASLLLGTASGIHPHHARRYFRRVQTAKDDPVYQHFVLAGNRHMTEQGVYDQNNRTDVITFPVEAPKGALVRKDVSALDLLGYVQLVQKHWVRPGTAYATYSPGLEHNVSNTITVEPKEWGDVAEFIWQNRRDFTGIALLQDCGDKAYPQAPREEVTTRGDHDRYLELRADFVPVDYSTMRESDDQTKLKQEAACAGGACEL